MSSREPARRILERLLANGPLTALPKRPGDQHLVALLAAARFAPGGIYLEAEVNARLVAWLETISVPYGIDHVTMRRLLVDSRLLTRTKSGSSYHLDAASAAEIDAVRALDPAELLATIADERDRRKRQHAA
jgi:hypothetical protein